MPNKGPSVNTARSRKKPGSGVDVKVGVAKVMPPPREKPTAAKETVLAKNVLAEERAAAEENKEQDKAAYIKKVKVYKAYD